jgi:hypothetical protein
MLRDNLVGLIEPMPTPREKSGSSLALGIPKQRQVSDDRSSCLENPRPEGAESALTERLLLHFRLNQDKSTPLFGGCQESYAVRRPVGWQDAGDPHRAGVARQCWCLFRQLG